MNHQKGLLHDVVLGTSQQGIIREPISSSGRFPGCICTGSRNSEAADSNVFLSGINKRRDVIFPYKYGFPYFPTSEELR